MFPSTDVEEAEERMENAEDDQPRDGRLESETPESAPPGAATRDLYVWQGEETDIQTIPTTLVGDSPGLAYRCANDFSWTMRALTEEVRAVTGYDPGELLGNRETAYADIISPSDRTTVWYRVQRAIEAGEAFEFGYRIERKQGDVVRVREEGRGVYREGHLVAIEGTIRIEPRERLDLVTVPEDGG